MVYLPSFIKKPDPFPFDPNIRATDGETTEYISSPVSTRAPATGSCVFVVEVMFVGGEIIFPASSITAPLGNVKVLTSFLALSHDLPISASRYLICEKSSSY